MLEIRPRSSAGVGRRQRVTVKEANGSNKGMQKPSVLAIVTSPLEILSNPQVESADKTERYHIFAVLFKVAKGPKCPL